MLVKKLILAASVGLLSSTAALAGDINLNVSGTITPSACTLASGDNLSYTFANIADTDLNAGQPTHLGHQGSSQFIIRCDSPRMVKMKVVHVKPQEQFASTHIIGSVDGNRPLPVGLHPETTSVLKSGGKEVGTFVAEIEAIRGTHPISGSYTQLISSNDNQTWKLEPHGVLSHGSLYSVANADGVPAPVSELFGDFVVGVSIRDKNELDLSDAINFSGNASLELVY